MNKINTKIGDILLNPLQEKKRKELERLRELDYRNNPKNFSHRSWTLIFQTLDFIFKDTPIYIYNRNKQSKQNKGKKE